MYCSWQWPLGSGTVVAAATSGATALIVAADRGHLEVVRLLIEAGADANVAIAIAAQNGHLEVVELLLQAGADKNAARQVASVSAGKCNRLVDQNIYPAIIPVATGCLK